MAASKIRACFPCIPAKKQTTDPNAGLAVTDGQDECYWQDGNQAYSKKQVCKAVAIVLSGYDSKTAANSIDPNLDPCTVDIWVQLYRPTFFEDGMACPPALVLWWMNEADRKRNLGQVPLQAVGSTTGPVGSTSANNAFQSSSGVYGTSYMKVPFITPDGTVVTQTVTTPKGPTATGNAIVISSPSASQPNIRVVYQNDTSAIGPFGSTTNQTSQVQPVLQQITQQQSPQQQTSQQQPQRPNSSPTVPAMNYDVLGATFQQQLTALQQRSDADEALASLQAQTAALQAQTASLRAQNAFQAQGQAQAQGQNRGGRLGRGGPPYTLY